MYRIGFKKFGSKNWIGGHNYLKNLSSVINTRLRKKIELKFIKNENESLKDIDVKKFDKVITIKNNEINATKNILSFEKYST